MKINSNQYINQLQNRKNISAGSNQGQYIFEQQNTAKLPVLSTNGISQVNSELPVSYSKINGIEIPGLKEKASVFKLANGHKVIIAPLKGAACINTAYNCGSLNETDDIRGISHFIEHNLFNGSKNLKPGQLRKEVSDFGGQTNAETTYDYTLYLTDFQLLKEDSLEKAIKLNAMQTQFPAFPIEQFEKEKEVVKSELDMYKDMPSDAAESIVMKNLFNINTKCTDLIGGNKENIDALTRDKVLDYYNTWYTPDNAVTVITGDVDVNETINLVSKYYNKPLDLSKANQKYYEPISYNEKPVREDIIHPNASCAGIYMGFAIPEGTSKEERDKIDTLISLLTSSGSRLSKALDENYGLSFNIDTQKMQNKPDGANIIMLEASPPENYLEDTIKTIYEELAYIADNPPSVEELNNVKKTKINSLHNISETSRNLNYKLITTAMENDYNYFKDTEKNIQNITPQDISDTARKFLDLNKVSMCVSHENTSTPESINNQYNSVYNSGKQVSFGSSYNIKNTLQEETDKVKSFRLCNNIETLIIPHNKGTKSSINLSFDTDELNFRTYPSLIVLNKLLQKRINKDILNSKDIKMDFNVSNNGLDASVVFNDENIYDVTSHLKEILINPNFSQSEFKDVKNIIKGSMLSEKPSAEDKLKETIFPEMGQFASKEEKLKQLEELTLEDIQKLYSQLLSTSKVSAAFSTPIEEKPYLQDIFNSEFSYGLPVFKPYTKEKSSSYNMYKPNTEAKILTTAQETTQAEIIQAYTYKKSENIDDIAKIKLLDLILGQGNSSRLYFDLREDKKLAYTTFSYILEEKDTQAVLLKIRTTTGGQNSANEGSPDNTRKALEGFERNVNLLKNENVTQEELERAKMELKTRILNSLEKSSDKTTEFLNQKSTPYDIRYNEELFDAIDRTTADDIRAAANYVFKNPPITSISASQKTLEALNLQSNN